MFSSGPNYGKLKINLNLVTKRLKMLEKKKTEISQKSRKEIADYLKARSVDRARIKVEQIIREDYLVEAMEIVEMYCDLLVARFGIIQTMKTIDEGLAEAISSIIWAAPRLQADVGELQVIADQLTMKYGKQYGQACRDNGVATVSPKLQQKLGVQAPPRQIVEKYLVEIARHYNVEYEPEVVDSGELIDFGEGGHPNNLGGGGWSAPPQPGFKVSNYPAMPSIGQPVPMLPPSDGYKPLPPSDGYKPFNYPSLPAAANAPPGFMGQQPGQTTEKGHQPQGTNYQPPGMNYPPQGVNYQPQGTNYQPQGTNYPPQGMNYQPPGLNFDQPPPYMSPQQNEKSNLPPSYNQNSFGNNVQGLNEPKPLPRTKISPIPPNSSNDDFLDLPPVPFDDLPSVPSGDYKSKGDDDEEIDFDELTRRFEDLKKRKN